MDISNPLNQNSTDINCDHTCKCNQSVLKGNYEKDSGGKNDGSKGKNKNRSNFN